MLVDPNLVAGADLDPEAIEAAARNLRRDADAAREASGRVVGAWQGLGACYEAPETDQVLRALDPVTAGVQRIADNLEQVASALEWFAADVRAIGDKRRVLVADMQDLRSQAASASTATFTGGGFGAMPGMVPPELAIQNAALVNRAVVLAAEVEDAERACARKIEAVGAPESWGEKALGWFADVGTGIGNSFGAAVRETKDAWNDFTDAAEEAWDGTIDRAADTGRSVDEWFDGRINEVTTGVDQGRQWIDETAADIGDWYDNTYTDVSVRVQNTSADLGNWFKDRGQDARDFGQAVMDAWPRTAAVGARTIMSHGSGLTGGLLFRDGEPYADEPVPSEVSFDPDEHDVPYRLDDLTEQVTSTYENPGEIRVTTVQTADGPRVIVSVPGTEEWSPLAGDNPMDLTGDLATVAGWDESTMDKAIRLAMANAEIPEDAQVMMVGHSLGGMTVAALADDPEFVEQYNVTNVVTFGSPIDSNRIGTNVDVLELQHATDVVPRLDFEDALWTGVLGPLATNVLGPAMPSGHVQDGQHHSTVTFANPGEWWDAGTNHSHENYSESIRQNIGDTRLVAYEQQLREAGFLLDPPQGGVPWAPGTEPPRDTWPDPGPGVSAETIRLGRSLDETT